MRAKASEGRPRVTYWHRRVGGASGALSGRGGVGKLGIVDFDFVDISNLQRQIIHSTKDINRPKVASAKDKIKAINPEIQVETYNTTLSSKNALEIIREYDTVVDGTDNYPTRYLINDACVLLGKPLVYGSIFQFEGQASVFMRARALLPLPLSRATAAGAGALLRGRRRGRCVAGIIGTIQAAEAIKLIVGGSESLIGRLLLFDVWQMKQRELRLERDRLSGLR